MAPVADDTAVAAYGGYVAWSERGTDRRWRLVVWHDGARRTLDAVPSRKVPFDVDLGPDAAGRPTAVFSRCAREAPRDAAHPWERERGCRLRAVTLTIGGAGERRIALPPAPAGASDTTPALWRDRVVFQRRRAGHRVSQLIAYDFRRHRARTLRHGTVPRRHGRATAAAEAIDLVGGTVAFVWTFAPPRIGVGDEDEARAERLSGRPALVAGGGYTSGECGVGFQVSPNATPTGALFLGIGIGFDDECSDAITSTEVVAATFAAPSRPRRVHALDGLVVRGLARDAATGALYAVTGRGGRLSLVRA